MSYVERRDAAVCVATELIDTAMGHVLRERHGLAASALRDAADRLDRAAGEQECIDRRAAINQIRHSEENTP